MEESGGKKAGRYIAAAVCAVLVLVLAAAAAAYQMGRSAGPAGGGDIGQETAKAAALRHAEVSEDALARYEIAREERGGAPVYEVKFTADSTAYEYEVSAADGSIVKFSRTREDDAPAPAEQDGRPDAAGTDIGEAKAWEIAYGHAGVTAEEASASPVRRDYESGTLVYELEFFSGGYEYDYEISAADGSVVKFEKEQDAAAASAQTPVQNAPEPAQAPAAPAAPSGGGSAPQGGGDGAGTDIGEAKAREIALAHAGVAADSVGGYKWELDRDGGALVYELEFSSGGYDYDYEISAADGSVLKFEKEATYAVQAGQTAAANDVTAYISEARAWEIACGHACLAVDAVTHCGVELGHHGGGHHGGHGRHHGAGCCIYEIDFKSGGYEYEYKIDAVTGEILSFQQEADD